LIKPLPAACSYQTQIHRDESLNFTFLFKIVPGVAERSYGIHVAKLAGLPASVIDHATTFLSTLEAPSPRPTPSLKAGKTVPTTLAISPNVQRETVLRDAIIGTALDDLAPKDALQFLYRLREMAN